MLQRYENLKLGEDAILLDAAETGETPYVYRNAGDAFRAPQLRRADAEHPVTLYIAPGVYWIDDPEATDILQKKQGEAVPFGICVECRFLKIIGLSEDAAAVVLAGNRGQSHGANGNYTMFLFRVEELWLRNVTIGNYCSVDLIYPGKEALNRSRRTDAITQAQLGFQEGEKLFAKNCRFVSRLNLCPVCGAERALYEECHFESTDDALNGNAVYLRCDFDFYGNRPIYQANGTGTVFLDCLFRSKIRQDGVEQRQYLTKEGGQVVLIDCAFEGCAEGVAPGWTKYPDPSLRCYQYRVTCNGRALRLGGGEAVETVELSGKPLLQAYLSGEGEERHYCLGNLLGEKTGGTAAALRMPTFLELVADRRQLVSGEESVTIVGRQRYFTGELCGGGVSFFVREEDREYVRLVPISEEACLLEGCNRGERERRIVVCGVTESGLEAATEIVVFPSLLEAPHFLEPPVLTKADGAVRVSYTLSCGERADSTDICWYRCADAETKGETDEAVPVAVSREGAPCLEYSPSEADEGSYLLAVLRPGCLGSLRGEAVSVSTAERISAADYDADRIYTDFSTLPLKNSHLVRQGCWSPDCAKPVDLLPNSEAFGDWSMDTSINAWSYGETGNGSVGAGLYQSTQGARLRYTPAKRPEGYGDMRLLLQADPAKTAGQGFGSAGQYMDVGIKFDTESLTGYALRVKREKTASDAVFVSLVEYRRGTSRQLTEPQKVFCFLTGCSIALRAEGEQLTAVVEGRCAAAAMEGRVELRARMESNPYGGVLVWHTGTPGTGGWQNTVMLHSIEIGYEGSACTP